MLILSRKLGEQVVIDGDVVVTVVAIRNGRIRLGIEAPREKRIERAQPQTDRRQSGVHEVQREPRKLVQCEPCGPASQVA